MASQIISSFKFIFWENSNIYIGMYGKQTAHSLINSRIVAPTPSLATLVLKIGLAYMRSN